LIAHYTDHTAPLPYLIINTLIRIAVLGLLTYLVVRTARQTKELQREVLLLEGILPICMFCKRIRDEKENWQPLEHYISEHTEADFSHGLYQECAKKHYGDFLPKT